MSGSSQTGVSAAPEKIDSLQYIRVLLEQMASRRDLINISNQSSHTTAISTLMRVDGKRRELILDKPYVTDQNHELELSKSDSVTISGVSGGSSISFQAEFIESGEEQGLPLYSFSFPNELSYSPQRASHRVDTRDFGETIAFTTSSEYQFEVDLCDISDGGLRVRASKSAIKGLTKGDEIFCRLDIEDGSCNKVKVRLCKPSKTDDPNTIEFGATFIDLSPHQKGQISHHIAGLERKLLRKQHSIPESVALNELSESTSEAE